MKTQTAKIETKAIALFIKEMGYTPTTVKVDDQIVYADGYSCMVIGNSIKKTHGLAWRTDRF